MRTIEKYLAILNKKYGKIKGSAEKENSYEILIATVISQRTKDETTEKICQKLFKVCPTLSKLAKIPISKLEKILFGAGFYRQKAVALKQVASILVKEFAGVVPNNLTDLLKLPKVGRKTANCVLVYGYKIPAIPVDTHVQRITNRLGWVKTKKPEETETSLEKVIPKKYWLTLNRVMVAFGKNQCLPINPKCSTCPLLPYCPFGQNRVKKLMA